MAEVTLPDGRILHLPLPAQADSGAGPAGTLAQLVWMSGQVDPPALCSGLGRCGRCAARFTRGAPAPHPADEAHFSPAELVDGWRLLCRHAPTESAPSHANERGMAFTLPAGSAPRRSRVTDAPLPGPVRPDAFRSSESGTVPATGVPLLLAIDLGTTTLHWSALTPDGCRVAHGAELNPQMGAGSEVMSRLAVASSPQGLAALRRLTLAAVVRIAAGLPGPVRGLCVAGNSAMTAILLGRDVSGLAAAPYRLDYPGGTMESLPELADLADLTNEADGADLTGGTGGIGGTGVPVVWIPPQPAPFVGGDVGAGMAALLYGGLADTPGKDSASASLLPAGLGSLQPAGLDRAPAADPTPTPAASPRFPFLLADLGTNGEFVLATGPGSALVTSVALGPALEGIGLSCGGVAQPGAIAAFTLGPAGLVPTVLPEDGGTPAAPTHLCGTGYLSLLRVLLRAGLLDEDGRFVMEPHSPLARRLAASLDEVRGERRLPLPGGLHLSAGDIEEVLKVKAAFSLAYERLLAEAGMPGTALDAVYLAGALGEHARPDDLETLGFLPAGVAGRTRAVGNASLRGAELLLLRPELRARINAWRTGCRVVDLTTASDFSAAFLRHMRFR
ncbi:MAG: ASKHA domain-containing protein [Desulfovibrio sp.]|jgi:hypothetical protein|nr:ASKHA domain-containing protein [Desulfovibrio sp.]